MSKSCLIIIDMQEGIFNQQNGVFNSDILVFNIVHCIQHAFDQNMLVVVTQHENKSSLVYGSEDWKIINSLQDFLGRSHILEKKHPSIYKNTFFQKFLEKGGITSLYFGGLVSNGCIKAACLESSKKGFITHLIEDGHSTIYKNADTIISRVNTEMKNGGIKLLSAHSFVENCAQ